MRKTASGYPRVYPMKYEKNESYYYRFSWDDVTYRSEAYATAKEAYQGYKKRFLEVVKESFKDD